MFRYDAGRAKNQQAAEGRHNGSGIAIKARTQLETIANHENSLFPGLIFRRYCSARTAILAVPDCYLPFLEATTPCTSASDCPSNACIHSINRMQRVCCEPKKGSVQPVCSSGKPAPLPILCDPQNTEDACPDDYECRESTTDFEKVGQSFLSSSVLCSQIVESSTSPFTQALSHKACM
ncbi:hypothetical protein COOONC_22736 [Cooperia oncophora]